jgi:DNA-directed RNA polymerase specialized sigma24 family protein
MRYFLDMTELEIAAALGCSPGTVKQHASRGLVALRRELNDRDMGDLANA